MGEYLQGTLQQRMRELREARDYSQAKVAGILGIDKASYGRMENGTTRTVNSDVLTGLTNLYDVSADYLLGISDVPQKTYYDLKALGLSVEAAASLLIGLFVKKNNEELRASL